MNNVPNKQNYTPFNNNRKYGKRKNNNNKYVTIHNNYNIVKPIDDNNQTKKIINEFNKPINSTSISQDRYSPVFEASIPSHIIFSQSKDKNINDIHSGEEENIGNHIKMLHILRSNNGSPLNQEMNDILLNETPPNEKIEEIIFTDKIESIGDLIKLSKKYPYTENDTKSYSIDIKKLQNIVPYLQELEDMIGMEQIKTSLTEQLMYFLQGFEYKHMLHTIIEGPPGVGKTCLGKILGNIYLNLNCINDELPDLINTEKDEGPMSMTQLLSTLIMKDEKKVTQTKKKLKFKIAKRSDMVGQYVGHTAVKTQKIINESFGGVLFIDEAYSLGGDDAFSKECINTLNQNLSENGDKFICIIAGYADSLETNFFSYNSGLNRRFPFRYRIEKYSGSELSTILKHKIKNEKYIIDSNYENQLDTFIENNKESFPNFGGDIETYFFHVKMAAAKRVFGCSIQLRKILIKEDFENGLEKIKTNGKKEETKLDMYS